MLDADEGSEVAHASTYVVVSPQYFDGGKRIGSDLARTFGVAEPMWDTFFFYPRGARWTADGLPPPALAIAQTDGVVVGTPGAAPALPDQSRLPPALAGKAVVIGDPAEFDSILEQVSARFVGR